MKYILVFFVCCLAVALTNASKQEDRKTAEKLCREEMNLTDKDLADPKKLGCFYRCVHQKEGYDISTELKSTDPVVRQKAQRVLLACAESSMGDVCKASLCEERNRT